MIVLSYINDKFISSLYILSFPVFSSSNYGSTDSCAAPTPIDQYKAYLVFFLLFLLMGEFFCCVPVCPRLTIDTQISL